MCLRPARADDLAALHGILSDARATAYWSTPPHTDLAQTRDWLQSMIEIPSHEGEDFVVEFQGRVIGKAGLYRFPEIGFILDPAAWGRGFASEAVGAVLERAFTRHALGEVLADVDPRNERSLRMLTRLGFEECGRAQWTWRVGDEWCDSVYLRLTVEAWQRHAAR